MVEINGLIHIQPWGTKPDLWDELRIGSNHDSGHTTAGVKQGSAGTVREVGGVRRGLHLELAAVSWSLIRRLFTETHVSV